MKSNKVLCFYVLVEFWSQPCPTLSRPGILSEQLADIHFRYITHAGYECELRPSNIHDGVFGLPGVMTISLY